MSDGTIGTSGLRVRFCAIKTGLRPAVVFLLTVPRQFRLVNSILNYSLFLLARF